MRFVLAIVAFVVAAAMITLGLAERTVLAPPTQVSASARISGAPKYVVVDGSVLNSHPGQQTLYVDATKKSVVAYGRTADVKAWLGDLPYANITYDQASGALASTIVTQKPTGSPSSEGAPGATGTPSPAAPGASATPAPASPPVTPVPTATPLAGSAPGAASGVAAGPNPAGSDLWLDEFDGSDANVTRMNVPNSISVIIAADGASAAPSQVRLVWPLDSGSPWSGPLIVGGGALLLIGLALYLWAIIAHRRSRGPRRKGGPKMPKLPKAPRYKPAKAISMTPKGRRSTGRALVAIPIVLVGALGLSGCSTDLFATHTSSASLKATPIATDLSRSKGTLAPAVTAPQLERIVARISSVAIAADAKLDATSLATRFAGPALQLRQANYSIRAKKPDEQPLAAIGPGTIALTLPQATDSWPRTVSTVIQGSDQKQAPVALTLVQASPRSNYMVEYAVSLEPQVKVPDLAPASIGAAVVPPDSKLLLLPPQNVAAAYGDVLLNGANSKSYSLFDSKGDTLQTAVGLDYKTKKKASVPTTASLDFANGPGAGKTIAMATNDSGALVWVNLTETETLRVVQAGAEVNAGASAAALSGVASSKTGIASTFGYQLAFYVPPAGSSKKIALLGFAQGLVAASEVH